MLLTSLCLSAGQYYSDRHKWAKAAQYYAQSKSSDMLVECFYALEDFTALGKLMDALPDGSPLLNSVGEKFQSVGLCNEGVAAFLKVSAMRGPSDVLHTRALHMQQRL